MSCIYAYHGTSSALVYHQARSSLTVKLVKSTSTVTTSGYGTPTSTTTVAPVSGTLVHGAIIQIGSKRWFSSSVVIAYYAHVISGSIIAVLTISSLIVVLQYFNWMLLFNSTHSITGFAFLILALIVIGVGVVGHFMRYTAEEWDVNLVLTINAVHKYGGWVIIAFG
jgi:hypothetical protein